MSNIGAFGICCKCGEPEHFRCAATKDEEKKNIMEGTQTYICSKCLFKSPLAIVCDSNIPTEANSVTTIAEIFTGYNCNVCEFVGDSKNRLAKHMGDLHGKHPCGQCGKKFWLNPN